MLRTRLGTDPIGSIAVRVVYLGFSRFHACALRDYGLRRRPSLVCIRRDHDGRHSSDQPYTADFTTSQATTKRIFDLAKQADYFQGKLDARKKNIAFTGDKTVLYKDAQRQTVGTYNYSSIPAVQELTTLFENLSATLEFGHRLDYEYRYQKLALDEETKAMEDRANRVELVELGAIAPILHKIADDPSVINVTRARILRLLDRTGTAAK